MDVEETRDSLLDMVSRDPDVVSCLHRVFNTVLLNDIDVDEGGVAVKPELLATLNREYKRFFKDAVVLSYTCGFVPYYVARAQTEGGVRGIKVPRYTLSLSLSLLCVSPALSLSLPPSLSELHLRERRH
mgnify:CR=1 FL=1